MSFSATVRALGVPRRAIPLAVVLAGMLAAEWGASGSWLPCAIDAGLFAAFLCVAPASWRWAAARAPTGGWLGYAGFALVGGAVVMLAALVPGLVGLRGTYVIDPPATGLLLVLFLVGGWGSGATSISRKGWSRRRVAPIGWRSRQSARAWSRCARSSIRTSSSTR